MNSFLPKRLISTCFTLMVALGVSAQLMTHDLEQQLRSPVLDKHYVGFCLYDMDEQRYVYGHNQDRHFTPASNTKIFTLFTSLTLIGDSIPGLAYVERGDSLIFWGTGDPSFLHPHLENSRVFDFLKTSDKKLFYARANAQESFYRDGWAIEDYDFYYQPELSAFPIYSNLVQFKELSGQLETTPNYFQNTLKFIAPDSTRRYRIHRHLQDNIYEVSNLPLPDNYTNRKPFRTDDSLLITLLADTLKRPVGLLEENLPDNAHLFYSVPTLDALREMMLPSDNFIAEQLNMVAAFQKFRSFRTVDLRTFMKDNYYKLFSDSIQLRDGSGLSTYNKVTPRSIVELLRQIAQIIPDTAQRHYLFPAGGLEGTLKNVYPTPGGKPFIWAKTGTIHSVHCQSGYIISKTGKQYAFSFLNNNYLGSAIPIRKEMVRVMTHIYENY
ncbi:MAG: D-alanyl-D-alanine carboxypeptidase [Sphingobacterium sp.]